MKIEIIRYGEQALLVNLDQKIAPDIHGRVLYLHQYLQQAQIEAIQFMIPAYCSLTVGFDPDLISFETLEARIKQVVYPPSALPHSQAKVHRIPVCYDLPYAWDMEAIEAFTQLPRDEIILHHHTPTYTVYMVGFLPGFPYLGTVSPILECPRKQEPRLRVEPGSVGLAGAQTGIYPSAAPGGWQILGRTPIKLFDPTKEDPFLCKPGDRVKFYPMSQSEFEQWPDES